MRFRTSHLLWKASWTWMLCFAADNAGDHESLWLELKYRGKLTQRRKDKQKVERTPKYAPSGSDLAPAYTHFRIAVSVYHYSKNRQNYRIVSFHDGSLSHSSSIANTDAIMKHTFRVKPCFSYSEFIVGSSKVNQFPRSTTTISNSHMQEITLDHALVVDWRSLLSVAWCY